MMEKTTADMVKNYLEPYFYLDEIEIPYENPDGRIICFINKNKIEKEIINKLKEQIKENHVDHYQSLKEVLHDIVINSNNSNKKSEKRIMLEERLQELRKRIYTEEREKIREIIERKFIYSQNIKKTAGFFSTLIDMLNEKDDSNEYKLEKWQKICAPNLYNLEQGIYVEDSCKSEPRCGNCGDYIFLRKSANPEENENEAKLLITNLEQKELIFDDARYIFKEFEENDERIIKAKKKFYTLMINRFGKSFRERFNATRLVDEKGIDILENWEIYKNLLDSKKEFESIRE